MIRPRLVGTAVLALALGAGPAAMAASPAHPAPAHPAPAPPASTTAPRLARGVQHVPVPAAGRAVDTSNPDRVVGHGTPASCTSAAVVSAVARGGIIRFDCGPKPVVIAMKQTAKVVNTRRRVVLDGQGLVTLSGGGRRRILYQDTCDQKQVWATNHCQNQAGPQLVVQNLTFTGGSSTGQTYDGGGGGAIFDRGGQLKIVHSRFVGNRCDPTGPDLGGGAVRALSQFQGRPVYVVGSVFRGGRCSNGSALSSIQVSWQVLDDRFLGNRAIGHGANPQRPGTPGGGSGGAIYTDGDHYTLHLGGTLIRHNHANEGGGAVFYVSNDRSGTLAIDWSTLEGNVSAGFQTLPGIFYLGSGPPRISHSIVR